jgi:hypothetical protein
VNRPAPIPAEAETPVNANTIYMVGEIVLALGILTRKVKELRTAHDSASAVGQKLAAEEVSRISGQLKVCADILVRDGVKSLNRRSRV